MKRVALIVPWVGRHPWYWNLWLKSARDRPLDILVVEKTLDEFSSLINTRVLARYAPSEVPLRLSSGYKICDFKPMYGLIFEDFIKDYEYWAYGDCDVLYGRKFNAWLERATSGAYDVATVQAEFCAGPFTIVRNNAACNRLFLKAEGWQKLLRTGRVTSFDELGEKWFRRHWIAGKSYDELRRTQPSFSSVCWDEMKSGNLRLLHETMIDERCLAHERAIIRDDGRLMVGTEELPLFHFIGSKYNFGFTGNHEEVWISRGLPWIRDAVRFAARFLLGKQAERMRVVEWFRRTWGCKQWYEHPAWNDPE